MAFDLGYSVETIISLLDRFQKHYGFIKYNPITKEVAIKNWGKYNLNKGGKPVVDCLKKDLNEITDKKLIEYIYPFISSKAIKDLYLSYINDSIDDTPHDTSYDTSHDSYYDTGAIPIPISNTNTKIKTNKEQSSQNSSLFSSSLKEQIFKILFEDKKTDIAYKTWIEPTEILEDSEKLIIKANNFIKTQFPSKYKLMIENSLGKQIELMEVEV